MKSVSLNAAPFAEPPAARPALAGGTAAVSLPISLAGLGVAILVLVLARDAGLVRIEAALLCAAAYAITVLAGESLLLRTPFSASAGLDFSRRSFDLARIATKLGGLYATLAALAVLYWLLPVYRSDTYQAFRLTALELVPWLCLVAIPYVAIVDRAMKDPEDGLYRAGRALMGDWSAECRPALVQFALGWLVKGFFTPIMFGILVSNTDTLLRSSLDFGSMSFAQVFALASVGMFWIDVLVAVVGYTCALRLFDTHIRSTEPTGFGWAICLICYPPFQTVFMAQYLAYTAPGAVRALADMPVLQMVWGTAALVLLAIYTLATLVFGCRFSNLTNRGIIASGPYRFTKHPAYVAKNLYWWLLHTPFLTTGTAEEALRYAILLLGINLVYFLRARTEERHLSADPAYVAYAGSMNERSLFAPLGRLVPALRYRPPL